MASRRERREHHWALGFVLRIIIGFALIAVMTHTLVRPFAIPSGSMEPTLRTGDRVAVKVLGVDEHSLERGQVIGIGPSHQAHTVKRVIGLPGEKVSCCDDPGRVLVDGEPLDEPYVTLDLPFVADEQDCSEGAAAVSSRCFPEITVPEDSYLVRGDHRANSADSVVACRGQTRGDCTARFVRTDQIVGLVSWRWWPLPPGDALRDS